MKTYKPWAELAAAEAELTEAATEFVDWFEKETPTKMNTPVGFFRMSHRYIRLSNAKKEFEIAQETLVSNESGPEDDSPGGERATGEA